MASPDLDRGYIRLAHELDAAISCADFTKGASIVLKEVRSQIYGPALLKTAEISPTDVSKRTGLDKGKVGHGLRELLDSGVLVVTEKGRYRFIKNYELWTKPNPDKATKDTHPRVRRVSAAEAIWCYNSSQHAMSFKYKLDEERAETALTGSTTHKQEAVVSIDNNGDSRCLDRQQNVDRIDNKTLTESTTFSAAHIGTGAGDLGDLGESSSSSARTTTTTDSVVDRKSTTANPPGLSQADLDQGAGHDCGVANDPAEMRRLADRADQLFTDGRFTGQVLAWGKTFPASWILRALEDASCWPTRQAPSSRS